MSHKIPEMGKLVKLKWTTKEIPALEEHLRSDADRALLLAEVRNASRKEVGQPVSDPFLLLQNLFSLP